jgi:divalent metal cation (Fe/Co/Zn/Cd) transporter
VKRTGPAILLSAALLGAVAGFMLDNALTAWGQPTFTPAPTLPILLVLLGAIVLVLAYGVFRAARGRGRRLDPFRALRIAMLAKASSIVGAAVAGLGIGLVAFVLTRAVSPPLGSLTAVIATAVCGVILVVAGLIAEQLCTIRKDDDDEQPGTAGPPAARD